MWKEIEGPRRKEYEAWLRTRFGIKVLIFPCASASEELKEIARLNNTGRNLTPEMCFRMGLKPEDYGLVDTTPAPVQR